ncbi:protein-tyrosine phosphatase family protein [Streptomyces cucumeris]|uniref:protein-tyrosine phosphatase family protein n=1 Tax=Streptomyces cucumeris TaxID=2962890 RepID=UPI003D73C980
MPSSGSDHGHPGHGHEKTDAPWDPGAPGILRLPSGRLVRGRGLRHPLPDGPRPAYAVYLLGAQPPEVAWESDWLRWPDFRLPSDRDRAGALFRQVWRRAEHERVEVACGGGRGRTGTALACVAVLDGVPPAEAVAFVRRHYDRHAVETPWQRRYVRRFTAAAPG